MSKKALLIGINYPKTKNELRGCVNDVVAIRQVLVNQYGFSKPSDVEMITDAQATTANIKKGLNWLVTDAQPGDVLYFHFSGHGSQIPSSGNSYQPDGLDEIICPVDLDWNKKIIRNDDLKKIFDEVPEGVNLTVVLDCCHSGTMLEQTNQYKPLGTATRRVSKKHEHRYIPMPVELASQVKVGTESLVVSRDIDKVGLLISGCQSHQTSADAYIGGVYHGAATYYMIKTLAGYKYDIDYKTLVDVMNMEMKNNKFTQRPQLDGNPSLHNLKFLQGIGASKSISSSISLIGIIMTYIDILSWVYRIYVYLRNKFK